jgi:oligopeptide transport system substrate-binding protein
VNFRVSLPIAALVLGGCRGNFSQERHGSARDTFRYCISKDPATLDPALSQDLISGDLIGQVFEGLVGLGENNRYVPLMAESWDVTDGGKTYVFHLRKGAKFSNGREVQASDYKWTYERNCSPKLNAALAKDYLGDIVGAMSKIDGKSKDVSGVEVVDPYTLRLRLIAPSAAFLGKLTYSVASVIAREAGNTEINTPSRAIGSGPFRLVSFESSHGASFVPNAYYHAGAPPLQHLEVSILKDANSRLNHYRSGDLDTLTLEPQDVATLRQDPRLKDQIKSYDRPGLIYLGLNGDVYSPFRNRQVRRAFAMAIDRKKIVDQVLEGAELLADGILPPAMPGHRADGKVPPYNVAEARRLLSSAGFANGASLPPLTLLTSDRSPERRVVADSVVTQLRENVGIQASVQFLDWAAFLHKTSTKQAAFSLGSWYADYLDPQNFLSVTLAKYGQDRVGYNSDAFTALCAKADAMPEGPERLKLYAQAEDMALNDAVWIPLYFPKDFVLVSPRVKGLRSNVFGFLPHATVRVE